MREYKHLKIAVAGTGYVGLSIATLLAQHHHVDAVDIVPEKVELINQKKESDSGRLYRGLSGKSHTGSDCNYGWRERIQGCRFCCDCSPD